MGKSGIAAVVLWISVLLFSCPGLAFQNESVTGYSVNDHSDNAAFKTLYGEILEINQGMIRLHTLGREYELSFTRDTRFYCNGSLSSWQALRPVYKNAFFEAFLKINRDGDLFEVRGYYIGKECKIEYWEKENDNLTLFLKTVEEEEEVACPLIPGARVPGASEWLNPGEAVFVLFSIRGGVRAVYPI